ncbi:MAG: hypothetical protein APF80_05955 [Alphaproteobacteria bacterium BRH_c36]|nr:MAG: hypothetical protein APF80_05955 [Alphaproteobacteria bacterium BRH_c36]
MSKSDKDDDLPRLESSALETNDQPDAARRAAMLKMSVYAASLAPAMLVLTSGKSQATPDCGNPAWQLGLKRAGHSGC